MKHPCKYPGCPAILTHPGHCPAHASKQPQRGRDYDRHRRADPVLGEAARIRGGARWAKVRRLKLSADPLCEDPHGEHARRNTTESAKQVHHIEGLATRPDLAYHWSNLMSVCTGCHARIEAGVRKGIQTP